MHELSLACSVVELVEEELALHGGGSVRCIEITIGDLSGVDNDAFLFSLNMVLERSAFAGARVMVDRVKPLAVCGVCGKSFSPVSLYASCPKCGSYKTRLVSGQEFRLTSLIVETDKE